MGFNGQLALGPDKRQYSFRLISDGRFGFNGSQLEGVLTLAEGTAKHHLAASGTIQMPAAQVLGNSWNLRDVVFESFFDRDVFQISRLAFNMGQGSVKLNGSLEPRTLSMNVDLDAQNISISDKYAADTVVYSQPVLSFLDNGLSRFLRRFRPAGIGDAQLSFKGKLNDLSSAQLNGSLCSRNIRVCDERFPFLIEHIEGKIAFSGRSLQFSDLHGDP